jgi:hypothetical protein
LPIADCRLKSKLGNRQLEIGNELPTRLNDAGNLTLERQLAKTDAAQIELSQVAARSTAAFAASIGADRKLRFAF